MCAVLFLSTIVTDSYGLFGIAVLTFVIGGLVVWIYIGKTATDSDEEMQSCLSLKVTSAAALSMGLFILVAPVGAYIFRHPESDMDWSDLFYIQVAPLPLALWLIWESSRLWKKALLKSFQDTNARGFDYMDRRWWISKVISKRQRPHDGRPSPNLRIDKKEPHLVKVQKRR